MGKPEMRKIYGVKRYEVVSLKGLTAICDTLTGMMVDCADMSKDEAKEKAKRLNRERPRFVGGTFFANETLYYLVYDNVEGTIRYRTDKYEEYKEFIKNHKEVA